jgi:3',5'-cyclic AMP phosphodiesterase CpdA
MLIAQISDTHITDWGRNAYGVAPVAENLANCIEHINQLMPRPDLVLVTGDITYSGRLEEAQCAAALLDTLDCPYFVIPGNHDSREIIGSVFGGISCPSSHQGFLNYVIEAYPVRLIALDSTVPGEAGGEMCRSRLTWLESRLSEEPDKPVIIFMHHPPVKFGVLETDVDGFAGADNLGDVIEKYGNIKTILCGHIHLQAHVAWRGTVVATAPSLGLRLALDLTQKQPSRFFLDTPGYLLHYWHPQGNLVSHTVRVADAQGPFLFEEGN